VQHTCNVANTTPIQGHLENLLFDFRHAAMVTVLDEKRVRGTAGIWTAATLFALGGDPIFTHVRVLTSGTANLEKAHGNPREPALERLSGDEVSEPVCDQSGLRKAP